MHALQLRRAIKLSMLAAVVMGTDLAAQFPSGDGQMYSQPLQYEPADGSSHSVLVGSDGVSRLPPVHRPATSSFTDPSLLLSSCEQSLSQLIMQAQQASPSVAAAQSRVEAAAGSTLQASLGQNPTIGYAAQEIGNDGSAGQYGFFLQRKHLRGNKIGARMSVAEQESLAREIALQRELLRVQIAVRVTYYRTLVSKRRAQILNDLIGMADKTSDAIGQLVKAEEMTKTALFQSQLATTSLRTQLVAANRQYESGLRALTALVNMPAATFPPLECNGYGQLPDYQWDILAQGAMTSLKARQQEFNIAKAAGQVAVEQSKQVVDLSWQLSVYYDEDTDDVFTGVQVSHPLQCFDRNQGNVRRASAEFSAAQQDAATIVQQTMFKLADAFREYDSQRAQAQMIATELIPKSLESLKLTQLALSEGEIGYLEALISQQTFAQAYQQYFAAVDAAWQAASQLERQFVD